MTLAILIISFTITYYIYKKTNSKDKNNYMNEKLLLFMLFLACIIWFIVSILDFYNYGTLVFSPSAEIFIKDIMIGFVVLAISLFLWFLSIVTAGKNIKNINIDKNKIREVLSNDNNNNSYEDNDEEDNNKNTNIPHSAPSISVDYSTNSNDNNSRKGYFPYGHNPFRK